MSLSWTQPICERDWIRLRLGTDRNGQPTVDRPTRLREPHVEICSYCGEVTVFGVYIRDDPANVAFPREKD